MSTLRRVALLIYVYMGLLTTVRGILDWSQVSLEPENASFPTSVGPTGSVVIVLTTPCASGQVTISGTYTDQNSSNGDLPQSSNKPRVCSSGEESRTVVYSLSGNSADMLGKLIRINISVEHNSSSEGDTRSFQRGPLQFPVPVQSVKIINITRDEETLQIRDNADLVLVCESSPSFPVADIQWYRHTPTRQDVESRLFSSRSVEAKSVVKRVFSTLSLTVTEADNGHMFSCEGRNSASQRTVSSQKATIEVLYAPDITMTDVTVQEGQSLTVSCQAMGRPDTYIFQPFIQYWGKSNIMPLPGFQSGSAYTHSKAKATYQDSGQYECRVENGIQNRAKILVQTKRVTVTVKAPPVFVSGHRSFTAEFGQATNITQNWYSNSGTISNVSSSINGSAVSLFPSMETIALYLSVHDQTIQAEGYMVTFSWAQVMEADFGIYNVTLCNDVDCRSITVTATPTGPPLVPLNFTAVTSSSESVWLQWEPNFPGGDSNQYFDLYYRVSGSEANWTTETVPQGPDLFTYKRVTGLHQGTEYTFKLQSRNGHSTDNEGPFTAEIYVKTKDDGIPAEVIIGAGASVGLFILIIAVGIIYKFRLQIKACQCQRIKKTESDIQQEEGEGTEQEENDHVDIKLNKPTKVLKPKHGKELYLGTEQGEHDHVDIKHNKPTKALKPKQGKQLDIENENVKGYATLDTEKVNSRHHYDEIALTPSTSAGSAREENHYANFSQKRPVTMPKPKKGKHKGRKEPIYQNYR